MRKLALPIAVAVAALAGCATEEYRPMGPVTSGTGAPVASGSGAPVVSSAPAVSYGGATAPLRPAAGAVAPVAAIRAGTGTIETVTAVPFLGSASVGATAPGTASRLGIRMGDGTMQYLDYTARDLTVGSRVEITSDGFIRKI